MPLSQTQATLIASFGSVAVSGIVSFLVARYTVKNGPDYSAQIKSTNDAITALAATQEEMRKQHVAEMEATAERHLEQERKAEASRWKPDAHIDSKIEGGQQINKLVVKSPQSFYLTAVSLLAPGGGKMADYSCRV